MSAVDVADNAVVGALLAAEYLKEEVPIEAQTEDVLNLIINAVSTQIEKHCRRPIIVQTYTEYHDGNGTAELTLRNMPIDDLTSVDRIDEDGASLNSYTASDFVVIARRGVIRFTDQRAFWTGRENWKIVYDAGLAADVDAVPGDIRLAALEAVAVAWRSFSHKRQDLESLAVEGQSTTFVKAALPKAALKFLEPYRVIRT